MVRGGNIVPMITNAEHIGPNDTGDNIEAKRTANYAWNSSTSQWERLNNRTDVLPATQNITIIDSGSASASGANNQTVVIGTPTVGSAAMFALSGFATVRAEVTGIWTGTLSSEISIDGGITWVSQGLHQGAYTTSTFTAGFVGGGNVSGATNYRMRATATMTGTAVVRITESSSVQVALRASQVCHCRHRQSVGMTIGIFLQRPLRLLRAVQVCFMPSLLIVKERSQVQLLFMIILLDQAQLLG